MATLSAFCHSFLCHYFHWVGGSKKEMTNVTHFTDFFLKSSLSGVLLSERNIFIYKNFPTFKIIIICNMASFMIIIKSYLFLHYRPNILSKHLLWSAMGHLWLIEAFRISLLLRCLLSLFSEFR